MTAVKAFLKGRGRFVLYAVVLLLLSCATALGIFFAGESGAYLTSDGDWQELAGEYRIGIIDYTVHLNEQMLIEQTKDQTTVVDYAMLVPLKGGSKIFDTSVTELLREKEFNEGVTLARIRVENKSASVVEVSAVAKMIEQSPGNPIRVLPLPPDMDATSALNLNYRKYVLDTLGVTAADLQVNATLDAKYAAYWAAHPQMVLPMGVLSGKTPDGVAASKEVYLLFWAEYDESYNQPVPPVPSSPAPAPAPVYWNRLQATFTIGQIE